MAAEEDASKIQLGEFQAYRPLWNSEVVRVLEQYMQQQVEAQPNPLLTKTLDYVKKLDTYTDAATLKEVTTILREKYEKPHGVNPFETAVLSNLMVDTVDEAMCLVPSLKERFEGKEDVLEELLDDLKKHQIN